MGVLLDPSISWGATACSGGHSACVVFRQLGVPVLETDEDYVWCFGCSFDGANLGIRRAKMEGMPMADTRDAAPQRSAEFASLWSWSVELVAHRWDKHMRIRALFKLFQRKAVL
jgi:hypothetical protein